VPRDPDALECDFANKAPPRIAKMRPRLCDFVIKIQKSSPPPLRDHSAIDSKTDTIAFRPCSAMSPEPNHGKSARSLSPQSVRPILSELSSSFTHFLQYPQVVLRFSGVLMVGMGDQRPTPDQCFEDQ